MALTNEEIRACTLIALDQPPYFPGGNVFKFTIYVDGTTLKSLNFYLFYRITFSGTVDWGDDSSEEVNWVLEESANHTYSETGT